MEKLISSAKSLDEPSQKAVEEFSQKRGSLATELKNRMNEREDLEELIGLGNTSMMEDNSKNMVDFFNSIFKNYEPKVFVDTVHWVFKTYRSHGFQPEFWSANLNTLLKIMEEDLSKETFNELRPFVNWIIDHIPKFVEMTDEYQR